MAEIERDPAQLFAPPAVEVTRRADGTMLLKSPLPLAPYRRCLGEDLEHWAAAAGNRPFLLERDAAGAWQGVTYQEALNKVRQIATALLGMQLPVGQPVAVLSDNGVEHALLMLACLHVGIPYAAVSPAYSLMSQDHAKLKSLIRRLQPAVIYTAQAQRFGKALAAIEGLHTAALVVSDASTEVPPGARRFSSLLGSVDEAAVARAFSAVGPDTVAKILFTSGSIAEPKGVINTQRMLTSSQQAKLQLWPFLTRTPPVIVDWLPWNHTFGANHNFNLVLRHGGTLYIDAGKPMPGLFEASVANLREIAPTVYFNVPRGFDMLVSALRGDAALRRNFFSRLQAMFYAGSALPQNLWEALIELSQQETGKPIAMVTAWGSTETSPLATDCHFQAARSGVIGLPVPGTELKLVPTGGKLEIRVRGPNVMPGYLKQPETSAKAFDEEGFYRIGDAVRFADPERPESGLVFDGRVAEDFKLSSGTWVNVGAVRIKGIEMLAPVAQDIVIAGHDRDSIAFLVFPNLPACRQLAGLAADAPAAEALVHPAVRQRVQEGLAAMKRLGGGSSTHATRALLMAEPPSVDAGEITDKGYINQSAVLARRAALVEKINDGLDPEVIALA